MQEKFTKLSPEEDPGKLKKKKSCESALFQGIYFIMSYTVTLGRKKLSYLLDN